MLERPYGYLPVLEKKTLNRRDGKMALANTGEGILTANTVVPGKPHAVKKCPECFSNLAFETDFCPRCYQKIKPQADKHGYAKKPINWAAYLSCFAAWIGAAVYIWWAFIKN